MKRNRAKHSSSYTYDLIGLVIEIHLRSGKEITTTKITYDFVGKVESTADGNENITTYTYD